MGRGNMLEGLGARIHAQVDRGISNGFSRSNLFDNHDNVPAVRYGAPNISSINLPSIFIESPTDNDDDHRKIANAARHLSNPGKNAGFRNHLFNNNRSHNLLSDRDRFEEEIQKKIQVQFDEARRRHDLYTLNASDILKSTRRQANRIQYDDRGYSPRSSGGYSAGSPGGYSGSDGGYSAGNSSGGYSNSGGGELSPARSGTYRPSGSDSTPVTRAPNGQALHDGDFFISQANDPALKLDRASGGDLNILFACGPTSLMMAIADWKGFTPTEEQRFALIRETETDVHQQFVGDNNKMGQYAAAHGLEYDTGAGWQELMSDLSEGRSAIVNGNWPGWNTGHFIYVAGLTDDGRFIVGDPALESAQIWNEQQLRGFMDRQGGWGAAYLAVWDEGQKRQASSEVTRDSNLNDLSIAGPPTISGETIDEVLAAHNSPVAGQGQEIFEICVERGIDPALALGFFGKESTFGTDGAATQTNSWGNIKNGQGGWRTYDSYLDGLVDWCDLMNDEYVKPVSEGGRGLPTLDTAIPVYAPSSDNNDVGKYINDVASWIADWRQIERSRPAAGGEVNSAEAGGASASTSNLLVGPDGQSRNYAFPVPDYAKDRVEVHHLTEGAIGASDIMAPAGTPIVAFGSGTVVNASYNQYGGNSVLIQQDDGLTAYYAHMIDAPLVKNGDTVTAGQPLGAVGNTGNAVNTDSHLHFGLGYGIKQNDGPDGGAGDADGNIEGGAHFNAVGVLNTLLSEEKNADI